MKKVEELLPILDEQVELLQQKLSLMEQMGRAVREADLKELGRLVERQASLEQAESELERRTERLREELARLSDRPADAVTLSTLVDELDEPMSIALSDRRQRLLLLVQKLRRQAATTAMLVRQAMELNEQMFRVLTGSHPDNETYSADGAVERCGRAGTFRKSI